MFKNSVILTILPDVENLIETPIFNTPVSNELWVGCPQVDLLIGQSEEGSVEMRLDVIGAELIEGCMLLLRSGGDPCPGLLGKWKTNC